LKRNHFARESTIESLEALEKLLFELASESRLGILYALQEEDLRMLEIARKLELTDTETSRQLQRLSTARLIQKQPNGQYGLTMYARLILDISSPLNFISKFNEYFFEHDASVLPCEFRARLGELSHVRLITGVETLNWIAEMFKRAEKKIDVTVVGIEATLNIMRQRIQEGLKVRWLMDESFLPRAKSILSSDKKLPEMRSVPRVRGGIGVTDKEAILTFRRNDGSMSYEAFIGEDPSFLKWAEDWFTYRWEKAKPWHP